MCAAQSAIGQASSRSPLQVLYTPKVLKYFEGALIFRVCPKLAQRPY